MEITEIHFWKPRKLGARNVQKGLLELRLAYFDGVRWQTSRKMVVAPKVGVK